MGHSITGLVGHLAEDKALSAELMDAARNLDKHYIPSRYPNGFDSGIPGDYYTAQDAARAIEDANKILEFCSDLLK